MANIQIQTPQGLNAVNVEPGQVHLIVGPNGVGKSALLQDMYRSQSPGYVSYYPGHRQITFSHGLDNLQMSFLDLTNNLFSQTEGFNRYKSVWPEEQFKHILKRLQNAENAYNHELLDKVRSETDDQDLLHQQGSPIQLLNRIFEEARMAVRFLLSDDGLSAFRSGSVYTVDRLSDGERAALFMAAAVVGRRTEGSVLIDEPERHLHPSISSKLVSAMVRSSPHIGYVFATHDLNLIETLEVDGIVYLQNSAVIGEMPERRIYSIQQVGELGNLPVDLKRDILGARDKILFVEGALTSLDNALYSLCYPEYKVSPRGGSDKVQEAVKALHENSTMHWLEVRGIVDGDGRDEHERAELEAARIGTLPMPSIENLFFLPEVVESVVKLHIDLHGGDFEATMSSVLAGTNSALSADRDQIIARRTAWFTNRAVSASKISVAQAKDQQFVERVRIDDIRSSLAEQFDVLADNVSLSKLEFLPLKASGIPARIASLCGASSLKKYKQIVIRQIQLQTTSGKVMEKEMRQRLPSFT